MAGADAAAAKRPMVRAAIDFLISGSFLLWNVLAC